MKYLDIRNKLFDKDELAFDSAENLAFEISEMIVDARAIKGITQEELAKLLETRQPSIARLENGKSLPSIKFLLKVAQVLKTKIIPPKFSIVEERRKVFSDYAASDKRIVLNLNANFVENQVSPTTIATGSSYQPLNNLAA